jgi:YggT family protein
MGAFKSRPLRCQAAVGAAGAKCRAAGGRAAPRALRALPGPASMATSRQRKGRPRMLALIQTIVLALDLYWWIIIASAVFSWLYAFNVVNPRNQFVGTIGNFLFRITEPALRPIRNMLPNLGGIDISPIILLLGIFFIQSVITRYIYPNVF